MLSKSRSASCRLGEYQAEDVFDYLFFHDIGFVLFIFLRAGERAGRPAGLLGLEWVELEEELKSMRILLQ